jgi:hypothetical protein
MPLAATRMRGAIGTDQDPARKRTACSNPGSSSTASQSGRSTSLARCHYGVMTRKFILRTLEHFPITLVHIRRR